VWSKGIWVARSTGVALTIVGIMAILGLIVTPTGMNDNNGSNNTNAGNHDVHVGGSKNMNMKPSITMPDMKM
jgi:hypothetical protein